VQKREGQRKGPAIWRKKKRMGLGFGPGVGAKFGALLFKPSDSVVRTIHAAHKLKLASYKGTRKREKKGKSETNTNSKDSKRCKII